MGTRLQNAPELDPGIRKAVRVLQEIGIQTLSSCEGRNKPGYCPKRDGPHHGDLRPLYVVRSLDLLPDPGNQAQDA